ncbi:MAG: AAA family ATPase [Thermodesulfobacteria bacterium]|nr:AAA family ATPase [Thermodesulfobacteriota bacterium]
MIDIPEFVNREKEKRELKAILSGRPNFVYFVYGPINSGKTALLMKVIEELPDDYVVFYINFRWRDVQTINDLIRVLFKVKRGKVSEETKEFIKEVLKGGVKVLHKLKGIPIPENMFDLLFRRADKVEDIFAYLEEYFEEIREEGYQPVLILDEMQTIKDVINATGQSVLKGLFNFLIGMTKERHLCHSLCATSDCLFIEDVYSNARLEGRAKYLLVDDFDRETAFRVYEEFGFEDKELVWDYIGGKIGDIISLFEEKKRGLNEKEALERMLKDQVAKLRDFLEAVEEGEKGKIRENEVKEALERLKEGEIQSVKIPRRVRRFLIEENIIFYNPVEGTVRPQSRLLWKAIKELV